MEVVDGFGYVQANTDFSATVKLISVHCQRFASSSVCVHSVFSSSNATEASPVEDFKSFRNLFLLSLFSLSFSLFPLALDRKQVAPIIVSH